MVSLGNFAAAAKKSATQTTAEAMSARIAKATPAAPAPGKPNPLYQIMTDKQLSQKERVEQVNKLLMSDMTKEANREKVAWVQDIQERLASAQTNLNQKLVEFLDSGVFAELQACWGEIGNDLNGLQDDIKPFMEQLDSLFKLRSAGETWNVLREIDDDRKFEEETRETIEKAKLLKEAEGATAAQIMKEMTLLGEQRTLFGFGGVSKSAREQIALKAQELVQVRDKIADHDRIIAEAEKKLNERKATSQFSKEKADFRNLLSDPDHVGKQKEVINKALKFIKTTQTRVKSVGGHLEDAGKQLVDATDVHARLTQGYAVLTDALKQTVTANKSQRGQFDPKGEEDAVQKIEREGNLRELDSYIGHLQAASDSSDKAAGDLSEEGLRINNMSANINAQSNESRELATRGIAKMTGQLSNLFMAINAGALNESTLAIRSGLDRVDSISRDILQQDALRLVTNIEQASAETEEQIKRMAESREVLEGATGMIRDMTSGMQDKLTALRKETLAAIETVNAAVTAQAGIGSEAKAGESIKPSTTNSDTF